MSRRPRLAPDAIFARIGDGAVVMSATYRAPYALNETAARVWGWLDEGADFDALASRLCAAYAAPRERVVADLRSLIEDLQAKRLITETAGEDDPGVAR